MGSLWQALALPYLLQRLPLLLLAGGSFQHQLLDGRLRCSQRAGALPLSGLGCFQLRLQLGQGRLLERGLRGGQRCQLGTSGWTGFWPVAHSEAGALTLLACCWIRSWAWPKLLLVLSSWARPWLSCSCRRWPPSSSCPTPHCRPRLVCSCSRS